MARIYDNIETKFQEGLKGIISMQGVEWVDFCVGYFNLRGWDIIVDQIDQISGCEVEEKDNYIFRTCRLLIGMHQPPQELIRKLYSSDSQLIDQEYIRKCRLKIAQDFRNQLLIGVPTKKDEITLRKLSRQLKEKKVCVKLYLKEPLHAKLYLAHRPSDFSSKTVAIMGSSNLTYSGFKGQGELNADFTDSDHVEKLSNWFDDRWNDRQCLDITDELAKIIDESWASEKEILPYYIYLKTAYHLSEDARAGIKEFSLSPEFQNELFDFQQTAVKIATKHLRNEKLGGAMIGDVVGLGKTITACAIANIYERTFGSSTLIICPANLQEMWRKYAKKYDLKVDIMSMSKLIDVDNARYYRLIIVDESHNLRNGGKRYQNIKTLIERQDSDVLLLTATPYNKDFSDLANQLKLFIKEDDDLGIRPEVYIQKLGGERKFIQKHSDIGLRTIKAFEKSEYTDDWSELMKLFLVRRTRTFIKENYSKIDEVDGRKYLEFNDGTRSYFPERKPKAIKFKIHKEDQYARLYSEAMVGDMESLELPRYGLSNFVDDIKRAAATSTDKTLLENLSRAGSRMMGFCKSTFFKRMDSSGFAFLLTLYRHILRNMVYVYAIENNRPFPIGDENQLPEEYIDDADVSVSIFGESMNGDDVIKDGDAINVPTDLDLYREKAAEYYAIIQGKNNVSWIDCIYFKTQLLKEYLLSDCEILLTMIKRCGEWKPLEDKKLEELEKLISKTYKNEKVLVFTQYSDTAKYICRQLKKRGIEKIAHVTGDCKNPTNLVDRFSPNSNGADVLKENELRVLIATDVLSEGQNLQDAHIIVNYDLPWAIIRLIQRAGRVDRIGQKENEIFCYSFFPADGVEKIIKLRKRLGDRINQNANVVGSDEIFFEGNEQNLRDMYNEKAGVLDDEEDSDVDLSSQAYQIWKNATEANPNLAKIIPQIPNIAYATKAHNNAAEQGAITYARTPNGFDVLTWTDCNGNIISQSQKRILQAMACTLDTPCEEALENHHELVAKAIDQVKSQNITSIGGLLGSRTSVRLRIVKFLEACCERETDLFFTKELKEQLKYIIDDIYNYSLFDSAKRTIGQMLNKRLSSEEIIESVIEMRNNNRLCNIPNDLVKNTDPTIICSMGLKTK